MPRGLPGMPSRSGRKRGGNLAVILSAAYLHDIGIHAAEEKHGSTAAKYQELEGPPIARGILEKLGARKELIDEVCDIVGHHHSPRETETTNFKAVYDADLIVNIEENNKDREPEQARLEKIVEKSFLTEKREKKGAGSFIALGRSRSTGAVG